jgi:hypothetical protein
MYLKRHVYILAWKSVIFVNIDWNGCMSQKIMKDCKVSFIHISNVIFFCLFWSNWIRSEWVCTELQHATLLVTDLTKANFVKYQKEKNNKYSRPRNSNSISFGDSCLIIDECFGMIANLLTKLAMFSPLVAQDSKPNIADFVNSLDISQKPSGN